MLRNLSQAQHELAEYMSSLSEQAYCAGWIEGLEFSLWQAASATQPTLSALRVTQEQASRLRELSSRCGGWIVFDAQHEETYVPLEEWERIFEAR
jgi:hypothetical protein